VAETKNNGHGRDVGDEQETPDDVGIGIYAYVWHVDMLEAVEYVCLWALIFFFFSFLIHEWTDWVATGEELVSRIKMCLM
jgi:hypothetical protein